MANTEGMPDAFVESLMTTSTTSTKPKKSRLQERMERPMPSGRPAATVIRASRHSKIIRANRDTAGTETTSATYDEEEEEQPQPEQQPHNNDDDSNPHSPFPLVGDVVEHAPSLASRNSHIKTRAASKGKLSRFAQQQQQNAGNGFPSVHVPLGTFVQNRQKAKPKPQQQKPKNLPKAATTNNSNNNDEDSSQSNAQSMLAQMAPEEIKDHQQTLKAALSPDMIAFLKRRGASKLQQQQQVQTTSTKPNVVQPKQPPPLPICKKDELLEKERLARLVSEVQTYQDLDAAYHAELNEAHPLEQPPPTPTKDKDDDDDMDHNKNNNDTNFQLACDLLRSTAPRQTLWAARVVSKTLERYVQQQIPNRDWPLVLPVSLRCLLDQPLPTTTGYHAVLHTYVLQSLYTLLVLNAHPDHVVSVTMMSPTTTTTTTTTNSPAAANHRYQMDFLDDAVPTPPLDSAYPSTTPVQPLTASDNQGAAAAYTISSSSTSAQADGLAFEKDPMWTLLSKMRFLPRLAQLLNTTTSNLPQEAWIASCGILCLLSQRSPGAASAIAHHATILPQIIQRMGLHQPKPKPNKSMVEGDNIAYAAMQLFCTLARQSRVTAQALPVEDILPPLLAAMTTTTSSLSNNDNSVFEFRLQQMALILWRTLLRYGLGLHALSTMMNLAARHLALPDDAVHNETSLKTEFVSAFAQVLECARLVRSKPSPDQTNPTTTTTSGRPSMSIPADAIQILSMASTYLSSTRRQVLMAANDNGYRWNAARLRFLSSCWSLSDPAELLMTVATNQEIKIEELSMEDELTCLEALDVWTDPGGDVERAWKQVYTITNMMEKETTSTSGSEQESEAAACAFLASFVSTVLTLEKSSSHPENRMIRELAKSVVTHATQRILEGLKEATKIKADTSAMSSFEKMPLARRGWINQCHFAIAKLLFHAMSINVLTTSSDINLLRMLVFSLLGRLEKGNESMAAVLFSQDVLFQPNSNPLQQDDNDDDSNTNNSSPISSMFLGELCGSDRARKQLDQSFKLQHGFGMTSDGFGPFALDSLLSDADQPGPSSSRAPASELVLPVGKLWLWQSLSGAIRMKDEVVAKGTAEAVNVVSAVLRLLLELEEGEELLLDESSCSGYAARVPLGAKLYYLMNVCLHPETVLQDTRVLDTADAVLDRYWYQLDPASVIEFSQACLQHTAPTKKAASSSSTENNEEELEEKDQKLFELFNPQTPNVSLSSEEMRSLEAFIEDLSTAYNDYGAQYNFFTKCMRQFLLPAFPSPIRCRTLRELREMLHLFTLSRELEDDNEMSALLGKSVSGGLPHKDGSTRDLPDVLDTVVSTLVHGCTSRSFHGYILNYCIAMLARNLATSLSGTGLEASKQRLLRLDVDTAALVFETATKFLATGGTKEALVGATMNSASAARAQQNSGRKMEECDLEAQLNLITQALESLKGPAV